ncbi:MAG: PD-(D/E)XK nuclease-like domain-containing protein, partial [SAR324 cluster bacterium]|nr:PD-(D/E)XK nuclease-like domain-containing protein [SAR324 cluster bacterium]
AWYSRGVYQLTKKNVDFLFVFIEKYAPHSIRVVPVSAGDLKYGLQKIKSAVNNISNANK